MKDNPCLVLLKNSKVVLSLILLAFFAKGVFLATLTPIFGGQDEARHYNTIQFLAQPQNAVPLADQDQRRNDSNLRDKDDFQTYNFSQEIQQTAEATDTKILRGEIFNTLNFSNSAIGLKENSITAHTWKPYNYYTEPDIVSKTSLYHQLGAQLEKIFAGQDILIRFYLLRIFSVLLGTLAILLAYLIARNIGFSTKHALILTAIISLQPKFAMYFTNINYDVLLIPAFFLFTLASILTLKDGLSLKNISLLLASTVVAVLTKPTGYLLIVIFVGLLSYLIFQKISKQARTFQICALIIAHLIFILLTKYFYTHFLATAFANPKALTSIFDYLARTLTFNKFVMPSDTYWGSLSWTNSFLLNNLPINLIFVLEMMALVGLGIFFFAKKLTPAQLDLLPAKKYILFLLGMLATLQIGIRIADWSIFAQLGGMKMSLGTPGRYFLPNLASHLILMFTGLGVLLDRISTLGESAFGWKSFSGRKYFDQTLLAGLLLMFLFSTYLIFDVIIMRFYL